MTSHKLDAAIAEAKRFLLRAEELKPTSLHGSFYGAPKEQGAVRRSSMDLSRAFADLRNPR